MTIFTLTLPQQKLTKISNNEAIEEWVKFHYKEKGNCSSYTGNMLAKLNYTHNTKTNIKHIFKRLKLNSIQIWNHIVTLFSFANSRSGNKWEMAIRNPTRYLLMQPLLGSCYLFLLVKTALGAYAQCSIVNQRTKQYPHKFMTQSQDLNFPDIPITIYILFPFRRRAPQNISGY